MNQTVFPGPRTGSVRIPASKSQAHRLLICAALGAQPVMLQCDGVSADIAATARCLCALGADITDDGAGTFRIVPIAGEMPAHADMLCGESGSTLRFLLPVVGALGADVTFHMEGRLPERPLSPLDAVLTAHGMTIRRDGALLHVAGQLRPGAYELPGDVSSQYISGLLMALPRLPGESTLAVTGRLESAGYIAMTEDALRLSGIRLQKQERTYTIPGGQTVRLPAQSHVEGDWSNAAFFLALGVPVTGLDPESLQGDRVCVECFDALRRGPATLDIADCPDLGPVLFAFAAGHHGGVFRGTRRLRMKESDRGEAMSEELRKFGAEVTVDENTVTVGCALHAPTEPLDGHNDHRIVMALSVLCAQTGGTIRGAEAVSKSFPDFFDRLKDINIEMEIR